MIRNFIASAGLAFLFVAAPAAQDAAPQPPSQAPAASPTDPDALAVRVRVRFLAPEEAGKASSEAPWEAENVKYTTAGSAAPFKLVGPNIVVFVGITPFVLKDGKGVVLIANGQVGLLRSDGGFSYQATVSKIDVGFGESVLFLPLGLKSPLRVEIAVFRAPDLSKQEAAPGAQAAPQKAGR